MKDTTPEALPGEEVRFEVLGPVALVRGGCRTHVASRRQRVVLALLLLSANRTVPQDTLIEAVWAHLPPQTARNQIQGCVSALRRLLRAQGARASIETAPQGYLLLTEPELIDLHVFQKRSSAAASSAQRGRLEEAVALLEEALAGWRGSFCADVDSALVQGEALIVSEERLNALDRCTEWKLALGRYDDVIGELGIRVARHPLRERPRQQLMRALHQAGRSAEALEVYRSGRRHFVDQLGLEPGQELQRLEAQILAHDPALAAPHQGAVRPQPTAPRQLPAGITDFTGRRELLDLLGSRLARPDAGGPVTVVAVSGAGGTGKSVTALHVAHRLAAERFPDGQLFADLGGSREPLAPAQVLRRFLRALGVPAASIPDTVEERATLYRSLLAGRRILVFLDDAATEAQVRPLLPGSDSCAVLLTSRSRNVCPPGASLVGIGAFDDSEAVELLGAIIGESRVRAEPSAARRIAELTGGFPLGVRIVGSRLASRPHWSLRTMAMRLADPRRRLDELAHGSVAVRDGLEAAYRLLPAAHRALLSALGGVDGAFPVATAADELNVDRSVAADLLEELVDAHFVTHAAGPGNRGGWYRLPELVGAFLLGLRGPGDPRSRPVGDPSSAYGFVSAFGHERAAPEPGPLHSLTG